MVIINGFKVVDINHQYAKATLMLARIVDFFIHHYR